ncbi:MAG: 2OG-Fe(II) oxygenase [Archangiaceae bacterium]|nr:2OG-Fe(II) oxygenase [Archangiaceae bacterium]
MSTIGDFDARELTAQKDAMLGVVERRMTGFIVRHALAPELVSSFLEQAKREPPPFPVFPSKHFTGRTIGQVLVVSEANLESYFASAAKLRGALESLGGACARLERRFVELFTALAGGLAVRPPADRTGRPYGPFTARELVPGGFIAPHCENETLRFPSMAELGGKLDPATQLSFYVPLQLPEAGGELELSGAEHGKGFGAELGSLDRTTPSTLAALKAHHVATLSPGVGDLLVFDAGRFFHQVTKVEGTRPRWTLGGFLAPSRARDTLYYWG